MSRRGAVYESDDLSNEPRLRIQTEPVLWKNAIILSILNRSEATRF